MTGQMDIFEQDLAGLEDEEAAVWRVIREHRGRANALKVDTVAWRTGMPEQKVREIVSRLVVECGKLIASVTGRPPGYYVITDEVELREHLRSLRHRGISILVRASRLQKASVEEIFKQAVLELKEDGDGVQ